MNSMNRSIKNPILIGLLITLSACASKDLHLGEDVRSMQRDQVYNKNAPTTAVDDPVPQDGQKAQIVIDTYREVGRQQKPIYSGADLSIGN